MNSKLRKYLTIIALGLAGGSIYFLPFIKYVFYDAQIAAMGINNTQSSMLVSMYGIINTILYIPGGIVADKVSTKKALVVSLIGTTLLAYIYALSLNFVLSMVIWAALSVSTAFVFWSALMKAVRLVGDEEEQGFMYGIYYACNGIVATLTNTLALQVYKTGADMASGFSRAVFVGGSVTTVAAIMLIFLMDDKKVSNTAGMDDDSKFHFKDVGTLVKNPVVWLISLVILVGYGFYSCISYFNPYLTSVMGLTVEDSGLISLIRNYLLLLLTPLGGLLADKVFKSTCKWLMVGFTCVGALFLMVMFLPESIGGMGASLYTLLPGAMTMMSYGVVFSTVSEAGIPRKLTGSVIGIASMIGYMPDFVYNMIFGRWLDVHGTTGYNYIFTFLAISGFVGAIMAYFIYRHGKKARAAGTV